uniref:Uncharacterized protein n=1 Tax=Oryzias melastigma TaxID=30732 RepID=A0A3B3BRP6_ORYME
CPQMESSLPRSSGGLWNNPRAAGSTDDRDSLRREQILTPSRVQFIPVHTCSSFSSLPQRRTAEGCRSGDSYMREKFHPGPTRDMEEEKRRLQNILATGKEETPVSPPETPAAKDPEVSEERFEEVLREIEERRQFLADMEALGQEREYVGIINTQISQVRCILTNLNHFPLRKKSEQDYTPGLLRRHLSSYSTSACRSSRFCCFAL